MKTIKLICAGCGIKFEKSLKLYKHHKFNLLQTEFYHDGSCYWLYREPLNLKK